MPNVAWLRLDDGTDSELFGLTPEGPVLRHEDCPQDLLYSAQSLLDEITGGAKGEVELEDDANWDRFPEVGAAFKRSGGEERSMMVAMCRDRGVWAAGVAGRWKQRPAPAKLALCLALALQAEGEAAKKLWKRWPSLVALCHAARAAQQRCKALLASAAGRLPKRARRQLDIGAQEVEEPPLEAASGADEDHDEAEEDEEAMDDEEARPDEGAQVDEDEVEPDEEAPLEDEEALEAADADELSAVLDGDEDAAGDGEVPEDDGEVPEEDAVVDSAPQKPWQLPRDTPLWIRLPDEGVDMPEELEGLPTEALALSTAGGARDLYAKADEALMRLTGQAMSDVEVYDDHDGQRFPMVGAALKEKAEVEECFCVIVCQSLGAWAVGIGGKGLNRQRAAKVALATTLAIRAQEEEGSEPELHDTLRSFVEDARTLLADMPQ